MGLGSLKGLIERAKRFVAPAVASAAQTVGRAAWKMTPRSVKAKKIASAREEYMQKKRRYEAVRRFLRLPRWYQDYLRPNFRPWVKRGRRGHRNVSPELIARRLEHAQAKRARKGEKRLWDASQGGYHYSHTILGRKRFDERNAWQHRKRHLATAQEAA